MPSVPSVTRLKGGTSVKYTDAIQAVGYIYDDPYVGEMSKLNTRSPQNMSRSDAPIRYHKAPSRADVTVSDEMSMPIGEEFATSAAKGAAKGVVERDFNNMTPTEAARYRAGKMAVAGGELIIDLINAQSAYANAVGQAQINILQARNQVADTLYRGRQAQLTAESEGYQAGQSALLAMAAQGQDVTGTGVGRVQGSYEAMGIFNGMNEQINSIREALGYELEIVNYEYQQEAARAQRNVAMIGSFLKAGASVAGAQAGVL